ncbi:MAG: hypothetical protein EBU80_12835 [Chitinophagia bacterium]|nr:hypothetical protein [Chitinophagia bacterium]
MVRILGKRQICYGICSFASYFGLHRRNPYAQALLPTHAWNIGVHGAVFDLVRNGSEVVSVTVADADLKKAEVVSELTDASKVTPHRIDVANNSDVADLMKSHDAVISCVNYWHNLELTETAISTGTHFCDLGGNNYVVDSQLKLNDQAKASGLSVIPDCGLAPGMVSILAMHGAKRFDSVDEIHLRVGGLPQNPKPPLDYQLVFSVEGITDY